MFSSRTKYVLLAAWVLFWVMMVSVAIQDYLREGGQALWQPVLWETSSAVTGSGLLLMQRYFTRRFDGLLGSPKRWFAIQLAFMPVHWLVFTPIAFGIRHGVYALLGAGRYQHMPWPQTFMYESFKITIFFGLFIVIAFGVLSYQALVEEKLRAERQTAALRLAQLQQLTQQMQPHFLFNALNTVSSLMHSDVDKADAVLIQLADTLRAALDASDQHQASLETELRIVRGFAAVMMARFEERTSLEWAVDDAAMHCSVPVMSVQTLLENVFKHTVEQRRGMTRIRVAAFLDAGQLVVQIADDAGRLSEAPGGVGLRNLRERLAVLHGAPASLVLTQLAPAGVLAEMRLPCAC